MWCAYVLSCYLFDSVKYLKTIIYGGPQLSHQNQMLTSNSNRSQQIQIAHSKLQITHSKLQIAHSKFKSPTANSNRPQQIQIVHSKLKSLTANSNCSQQIQITHSKLQITHSKLQIAHSKFKSPTANSNRSQQIKVAHSKFKLLAANYIPLGVFGYLQPAVQLV